MGQVFSQRYAYYGMLLLVAAFVLVVLLVQSCGGGLRIEGARQNSIESVSEVSGSQARQIPAMVEFLSAPTSPMSPDEFFVLRCSQIARDDISHLLYTDDNRCPSFMLPDALGFDVIVNYWDAACENPPKLVAKDIDGKISFTVDTTGNRGICEDMSVPSAFGIKLKQ